MRILISDLPPIFFSHIYSPAYVTWKNLCQKRALMQRMSNCTHPRDRCHGYACVQVIPPLQLRNPNLNVKNFADTCASGKSVAHLSTDLHSIGDATLMCSWSLMHISNSALNTWLRVDSSCVLVENSSPPNLCSCYRVCPEELARQSDICDNDTQNWKTRTRTLSSSWKPSNRSKLYRNCLAVEIIFCSAANSVKKHNESQSSP